MGFWVGAWVSIDGVETSSSESAALLRALASAFHSSAGSPQRSFHPPPTSGDESRESPRSSADLRRGEVDASGKGGRAWFEGSEERGSLKAAKHGARRDDSQVMRVHGPSASLYAILLLSHTRGERVPSTRGCHACTLPTCDRGFPGFRRSSVDHDRAVRRRDESVSALDGKSRAVVFGKWPSTIGGAWCESGRSSRCRDSSLTLRY